MLKTVLFSILLSLLNLNFTNVTNDWEFISSEKGVKLYCRTIDGFEYKEVKAILSINVDLLKAKAFLEDPNNIEKWMSGCSMSVHKKTTNTHKEYYAIFDAPWPITDRDDYGKIILEKHTADVLHLSFESLPKATPEVSSMVRVPFSKGHIKIERDDNGKQTLTYQMLVDRGGTLPSYLKDYLETKSPVKTIHKLKMILENKY